MSASVRRRAGTANPLRLISRAWLRIPGHGYSVIPDDRDHRFRNDRDPLVVIIGTVITMNLEYFPQGEETLDITPGKLFLLCTFPAAPGSVAEKRWYSYTSRCAFRKAASVENVSVTVLPFTLRVIGSGP